MAAYNDNMHAAIHITCIGMMAIILYDTPMHLANEHALQSIMQQCMLHYDALPTMRHAHF